MGYKILFHNENMQRRKINSDKQERNSPSLTIQSYQQMNVLTNHSNDVCFQSFPHFSQFWTIMALFTRPILQNLAHGHYLSSAYHGIILVSAVMQDFSSYAYHLVPSYALFWTDRIGLGIALISIQNKQ